jgi:nucleotide-binding universal stress UspA family protein
MTPLLMVPLDGSPDAEQALPWAAQLAQRNGGAVRLVGVHAPPAVYLDGQTLVGSVTPDEEVREQEEKYLDQVEERVRTATGATVSADLLDGSVIEALVQHAEQLRPLAVVMLAHGRSAIARFFLGSTALEFIRQSPVPVLLIRAANQEAPDYTIQPTIKHIVVPVDGSKLAEQIVTPALALGKPFGAEFHVTMTLDAVPDIESLAALHEPGLPGPWDESAVHAKAERYLEHIADRFREQGCTAHARVVPHGAAADRILEAATAQPDTVVALATHGRGGLAKLMWGSVTEQVVRRTTVPLYIVRPRAV